MSDIIDKIKKANPKRHASHIERRMLKLGEEFGEAAQALLAVTSKNNSKKKTWDDVREELTDVVIVAMDILLTEMPDEKDITPETKRETIEKWFDKKLKKWSKKSDTAETSDS